MNIKATLKRLVNKKLLSKKHLSEDLAYVKKAHLESLDTALELCEKDLTLAKSNMNLAKVNVKVLEDRRNTICMRMHTYMLK